MVIRHSVKELLAKNIVTRPMKYIVEYSYHSNKKHAYLTTFLIGKISDITQNSQFLNKNVKKFPSLAITEERIHLAINYISVLNLIRSNLECSKRNYKFKTSYVIVSRHLDGVVNSNRISLD